MNSRDHGHPATWAVAPPSLGIGPADVPGPPAAPPAPPAPPTNAAPPPPASPPPEPRRRKGRLTAGGAVAAVIAALVLIPGARNAVPEGIPVVGRNAEDVYGQMKAAGLPIAPGRPASSDYDDLMDNNACSSSKGFVRTDTDDTGWGFICVKPPADAHERMSEAFDDVPLLVGPLFVDDGPGDVVIIGFGWPSDASKTIYDAVGGSGGTYLVEK